MEILLVKVGEKDGRPIYSLDAESEKILGGREVIAAEVKGEKATRTLQQNKSIYKYNALLAEQLNEGGITKQIYFAAKKVDCEWTPEAAMEDIWREIQEAMFDHRKTSKLESAQVSEVYKQVARILSEHFSISQDFPSWDWGKYQNA